MPSIIISSASESKGKSALAAAIISRLRNDGVADSVGGRNWATCSSEDEGVDQVEIDQIEPSGPAVSIIEGSSGDPAADFKVAEEVDANVILLAGIDDDM